MVFRSVDSSFLIISGFIIRSSPSPLQTPQVKAFQPLSHRLNYPVIFILTSVYQA